MITKLCPCKVVFPKTHPDAQGSQCRKAASGNCSSTHWVDSGKRRQGICWSQEQFQSIGRRKTTEGVEEAAKVSLT